MAELRIFVVDDHAIVRGGLKALIDAQPDHLDYRSQLASCWNDLGLAISGAEEFAEAVAAQERAAAIQRVAFEKAPQVARYRRLLCNHLFNRASALGKLGRVAETAAAAGDSRRVAPDDPVQWFREARILALLAAQTGRGEFAELALAALRQAIDCGLDDPNVFVQYPDFNNLSQRPEFRAMRRELEQRVSAGMSQPP